MQLQPGGGRFGVFDRPTEPLRLRERDPLPPPLPAQHHRALRLPEPGQQDVGGAQLVEQAGQLAGLLM